MTETPIGAERSRDSYIWQRHEHQEPPWVSSRLFDVETFDGGIWDPACGGGNILRSAEAAGIPARGSDIVSRAYGIFNPDQDFFRPHPVPAAASIVTNPPFNQARAFIERALTLVTHKVAAIFPTARLNAARWLEPLPLKTIWLLTPRPSMPRRR
jgi:hypothetical protein